MRKVKRKGYRRWRFLKENTFETQAYVGTPSAGGTEEPGRRGIPNDLFNE